MAGVTVTGRHLLLARCSPRLRTQFETACRSVSWSSELLSCRFPDGRAEWCQPDPTKACLSIPPAVSGILDLPQAPGTKPARGPGAPPPSMAENGVSQASEGPISMSLPDAKRNFPAFLPLLMVRIKLPASKSTWWLWLFVVNLPPLPLGGCSDRDPFVPSVSALSP